MFQIATAAGQLAPISMEILLWQAYETGNCQCHRSSLTAPLLITIFEDLTQLHHPRDQDLLLQQQTMTMNFAFLLSLAAVLVLIAIYLSTDTFSFFR